MKVAVTGASGFVGRHLVRGLRAHGHAVRSLVRDLSTAPSSTRRVRSTCPPPGRSTKRLQASTPWFTPPRICPPRMRTRERRGSSSR